MVVVVVLGGRFDVDVIVVVTYARTGVERHHIAERKHEDDARLKGAAHERDVRFVFRTANIVGFAVPDARSANAEINAKVRGRLEARDEVRTPEAVLVKVVYVLGLPVLGAYAKAKGGMRG